MIPENEQAAQLLEGRVLKGGWRVLNKKTMDSHQTGGVYSCYYEVENGDRKGFLKAFDYSSAAKASDEFTKEINNITSAYNLEKEILEICRDSGCKNVIEILDSGFINVEEATNYQRVEYLILELAEEGDVRNVLHEQKVTLEWKIRSLHQLAKGLNELHRLSIAHQDVKPSNIVQTSGRTKLSDFGSATTINRDKTNLPYHQLKNLAGTWRYAPPELLYGDVATDDTIRRIGCDLYLLGSMVAFYFTDMSMTALIKANLSDTLCWTDHENYGKYQSIKAYVINAFEQALEDIGRKINDDFLRDKIIEIIRYLCNPDPMKRGHKKNIAERGSNFGLQRFITMFDVLARKIKLNQL
jgi:serine/threonine protein kinase